MFIIARKRRLGQGNIFTSVCYTLSSGRGGDWLPIMHHRSHDHGGLLPGGLGRPPESDTMGYGQQAGSMHPTGMHSCCIIFESLEVLSRLDICLFYAMDA